MQVNRAIIMAAGEGVRYWPFGINMPKSVLPLGRRTLIDCITVDECLRAGITSITIMVPDDEHLDNSLARRIKDVFSRPGDDRIRRLHEKLAKGAPYAKGVLADIEALARVQPEFVAVPTRHVNGAYQPYGTAVTVKHCLEAWKRAGRPAGKDEWVAILNSDDLVYSYSAESNLARLQNAMQNAHTEAGLLTAPVDPAEAHKYGIVMSDGSIIEHPTRVQIPPKPFMNVGRHIASGRVLSKYIKELLADHPGSGGEYQIGQVFTRYVRDGNQVAALEIEGRFLNCGEPMRHAESHLLVARHQENKLLL